MAANTEGNPTLFPVRVPEGVEVIHNPSATGNETEDVSIFFLIFFYFFHFFCLLVVAFMCYMEGNVPLSDVCILLVRVVLQGVGVGGGLKDGLKWRDLP